MVLSYDEEVDGRRVVCRMRFHIELEAPIERTDEISDDEFKRMKQHVRTMMLRKLKNQIIAWLTTQIQKPYYVSTAAKHPVLVMPPETFAELLRYHKVILDWLNCQEVTT